MASSIHKPRRASKPTKTQDSASPNQKKISPSSSQSDASSDTDSSQSHPEYGLLDLDEPMRCTFQDGESVWVKLKDSSEWVRGVVSGKGARTAATRDVSPGEGVAFPVRYNKTKRDYFAPQNGEVKPDTPEVRELLAAGGWLQVA
ncbi:hypothetical protein BD414DRAFT_490287 [Trametes punicea]|nr:hypothetical protein BD414DRAFT_490287 [Trametes punicea]